MSFFRFCFATDIPYGEEDDLEGEDDEDDLEGGLYFYDECRFFRRKPYSLTVDNEERLCENKSLTIFFRFFRNFRG